MADIEVQVGVQLASDSPAGRQTPAGLQDFLNGEKESDCTGSLRNIDEEVDTLFLTNVALLPPCGNDESCSYVEGNLQSLQLQLEFLLSKADHLENCLQLNGGYDQGSKDHAEELRCFLYTCQPFFNQLECITRSTLAPNSSLPFEIDTQRGQLFDFSQQLCDKLEQLVLTYASYNLLCLDESEPNSVSHFCIGQSMIGRLRLTVFHYCKLTPYLTRSSTGLYKRMRWNVERLQDSVQTSEEPGGEKKEAGEETDGDPEYYFLCCEDIPKFPAKAVADSHYACDSDTVRMWSIVRWVQVNPDPNTEDIYDWIMCEVPQGTFQTLLCLGSEEPSSCSATDHLQKLLLSHQNTGPAGDVCVF